MVRATCGTFLRRAKALRRHPQVRMTQHGAVTGRRAEGRLPFSDVKLLGQLRRIGFLTVRREGSNIVIGPGQRVRTIAKRWEISVPPAE